MTHKRLIAALLVALLSAVQVAAWAVVLEKMEDGAGLRPGAWHSLERLLAVMSEPTLIALLGCASIMAGIAVGMIGRKPQPAPDLARLQES